MMRCHVVSKDEDTIIILIMIRVFIPVSFRFNIDKLYEMEF